MARRRIPSYRCYKPKNLGLVVIGGKQHYLGRYGSPESVAEYNRLIQEWLSQEAQSAPVPGPAEANPTVSELILAFWTRFATQHYRRADGSPTGELQNYRDSLRPLRKLYGHTTARDFGPLALKAVRQSMIDSGLARSTINQRIGRIVRMFKWAVENEMLPPAVHQALAAVRGLQKNRTAARETAPVRPAVEADVQAIRPHVARQVWAMIELQLLTGMRPGEVCKLRTGDLETSGTVWVYQPAGHKTEHHGFERWIYLGPQAQAVLKPWLRADPETYVFSPREAVEERREQQRRQREAGGQGRRKTRSGAPRAPGRPPGACYTPRTYYHAVQYGCDRAGVPAWHPNQLRHNAATRLRREFGIEVARVILGHGRLETTEIYAEADRDRAMEVMRQVG